MSRLKPVFALIVLACVSSGAVQAQAAQAPAYTAAQRVEGVIRIWGPAEMSAVTEYWAEGFKRFHPEARIETTLKGSASAIPGLYSAKADIALLGRENNLTDTNGFGRVKQYRPVRLELMRGSLDVVGKSPALVVYTHKDNPLKAISLDQLDAIFGYERRRGHAPIQTWGDFGLDGEWTKATIKLYAYDVRTGTGDFFRNTVMGGSHKYNWDVLSEYKDSRRSDGTLRDAAESITQAAASDRYGLAISSLRYTHPDLKPIAVSAKKGGEAVHATAQSIIDGSYPLARATYAFVDVRPGEPLNSNVREFLRYVLSREGQADIARDRGYLPLSIEQVERQRELLEEAKAGTW
jgi:phosphate transport system substrate-binding protein